MTAMEINREAARQIMDTGDATKLVYLGCEYEIDEVVRHDDAMYATVYATDVDSILCLPDEFRMYPSGRIQYVGAAF